MAPASADADGARSRSTCAQRLTAPARVDPGEPAAGPTHSETSEAGRETPGLQRHEQKEEQHAGDRVEREGVPGRRCSGRALGQAVGGRRAAPHDVAQPGAEAEPRLVGEEQTLGIVEPRGERQRGRAVERRAGQHRERHRRS